MTICTSGSSARLRDLHRLLDLARDEADPRVECVVGWAVGEHEHGPDKRATVDSLDSVPTLASSYQRRPARIAPSRFMVSSAIAVGLPWPKAQSIESSGPAI